MAENVIKNKEHSLATIAILNKDQQNFSKSGSK